MERINLLTICNAEDIHTIAIAFTKGPVFKADYMYYNFTIRTFYIVGNEMHHRYGIN